MPIVEADLNSAELRVAAILANDEPFLQAFAEGKSPHVDTARELFGREISKGQEEYTFTKSFTYKWIYTVPDKPITDEGGQLRLYSVDLPKGQLAYMAERMNKLHPAMVHDKRRVLKDLAISRKIVTVFGRYRHFGWALSSWDDKLKNHAENAALNFRIQTVIGDIVEDAFIRADKEFEVTLNHPHGIIIQNHDALIVECHEREIPYVKDTLRWAIEQPVPELGGAIIPCEFKIGPSWGEAKDVP